MACIMSETARAAKRAYQKEWRKKNPEKVRAAAERYWQRRAEREAAAAEGGKVVDDGTAEN